MAGKFKLSDIDQSASSSTPSQGTGQFSLADVDQPGGSTAAPSQQQQPDQRSGLQKAWDWVNKGLVSGDTLTAGHEQQLRDYSTSKPTLEDEQHPIWSAVKKGLAGTAADTADTLSSFTSPASIALLGAGAATKALPAAGKLATAVRALQTGAGVAYGAQGAGQVARAMSDNSKPGAERLVEGLQGAAQMAGGAAATGRVVGKIASGISRVSAPLADSVTTPRGSIAPESATPTELSDYAQQNNIPVNAAQVTEHNLPRGLHNSAERSLIAGNEAREHVKSGQEAIAQHTDNLMNRMDPNSQGAAPGDALKKNISDALEHEQNTSRQLYAQVDQKAKGVGVDLRPVKQLANSILQNSSFIRQNAKVLDPARGAKIADTVANLPDSASFSDAQALRSRLIQETQHPDNVISEEAQGWLKNLTKATDDQMMTGAAANPDLQQAFRAANDHWSGMQENFNSPRSPLYQALKEPDADKVPQKFLQKGTNGGSQHWAGVLDQYGIDKGPLKRALTSDLAGSDFKLRGKDIGGYSDDFLRSVYAPDELDHIYKTGALARSIGVNTNPSGTATVESHERQLRNPVTAALDAAAAGVTNSPGLNSYMMRPQGRVAAWMNKQGRIPATPVRGGVASAIAASQANR